MRHFLDLSVQCLFNSAHTKTCMTVQPRSLCLHTWFLFTICWKCIYWFPVDTMKALKLWSLTLEAKSSDDRSMECHLIKFDIISQILLKFLGGGTSMQTRAWLMLLHCKVTMKCSIQAPKTKTISNLACWHLKIICNAMTKVAQKRWNEDKILKSFNPVKPGTWKIIFF